MSIAQAESVINNGYVVSADGEKVKVLPTRESINKNISLPYEGTGQLSISDATGKTPLRRVYEDDTRVHIIAPTTYPNSAIAYIVAYFPLTKRYYNCTGFFIGPRSVATAGHCLYDLDNGKAGSIKIYPGQNGDPRLQGTSLNGYTTKYRMFIHPKWLATPSNKHYDYAVIQTNAALGTKVGIFGYSVQSSVIPTGTYTVRGYPIDKPIGELWSTYGNINYKSLLHYWYRIDTEGNQSGSPLYKSSATPCCSVVGIHTEGGNAIGDLTVNADSGIAPYPDYNSAILINQDVYNHLKAWSAAAYP
jgi:glutamyl endopeptidase